MKYYRKYSRWILLNLIVLGLFFSLRCFILNLNILFSLLILLQGVGILTACAGFLFRQNRTRARGLLFTGHCLVVLLFFQRLGHLIGIGTLYVSNRPAIRVFSAYQSSIPVGERVNGEWILQEPDFKPAPADRAVLVENYRRMSPCLFENGYCYFELGGFLHNSGGYALRISEQADPPAGFGFTRIRNLTHTVGDWYYYQ